MIGGLTKVNLPQVIMAGLGLLCLTALVALHDISGDVAVPIISAIVGGGLGHVNGYRQGIVTNGNGDK